MTTDKKTKNTIKTTGELREFLVNTMLGVKDGVIDINKASNITKLAGQINESLYAEIKVARLSLDIGEPCAKRGNLSIGDNNVAE